jgi:hypothetical protein
MTLPKATVPQHSVGNGELAPPVGRLRMASPSHRDRADRTRRRLR